MFYSERKVIIMTIFRAVKVQLIIFLCAFAAYEVVSDYDSFFLLALFVSVSTTVMTDGIIHFAKKKRWILSDSSAITGLIIAFVLTSKQPWYLIVIAGVLAIASKHLIRFKKKHIFNPAAFGILVTTIVLSATTQWKGTYQWYILIPVGVYFIYRIRKMPLLVSYAVTALGIFALQALMQGVRITNIFGYLSYFFIFVMMIEPKTTPITSFGKIVFGIIIALGIFILTEIGAPFDVELCSLLIGNVTVPL